MNHFLVYSHFLVYIFAYEPNKYPVSISLSKIPCTESNYIAPIYSAHTKALYSSFVILTCLSIYCYMWIGCTLFRSSKLWNL